MPFRRLLDPLSHKKSYSKLTNTLIKRSLKLLTSSFYSTFNWMTFRKFIFAIQMYDINQHHKVFTLNTFNTHFSDTYFDLLHYRLTTLHVNSNNKIKHLNKSNSYLSITFTNTVFNKIKLNYLFNNEHCKYQVHSINLKISFKYPIRFGIKFLSITHFQNNY